MEVTTLKKYVFVLFIIALLLGISACSEKDNGTEPQILGYQLEQFIDADQVQTITDPNEEEATDFRDLYNYEIVASDGYSPRNREETAGYDLDWDVFKTGYMVPSNQLRTMFLDDTTPGAFEVKNAASIRLYRRIVVADTLGNAHYIELGALPIHSIANWDGANEDAIKLSDLLTDHSGYDNITLMASDGYSKDYNTEQIADGYYLLESERTTFPTFNEEMNNSMKRFKYIDRIVVNMDFGTDIPLYENADAEDADISFTFPELYDGFDGVELDLGED
jgi:hypothetical protein